MKCIQAIWPKHIPKGKHYQIIVFDEMTVEDTPVLPSYWARNPEPSYTKHYIQKIYATNNKEDWESDIKELMIKNPLCHMIAMVVDGAATITLESIIKVPEILEK